MTTTWAIEERIVVIIFLFFSYQKIHTDIDFHRFVGKFGIIVFAEAEAQYLNI